MAEPASPQVDHAIAVCAAHGNVPSELIEIFHDIQDEAGFIDEAALPAIAKALNLSRAEVHGVMSFYHDFRRAPAGRVRVQFCRAESCQSRGASALIEDFCARHEIGLEQTTRDGMLTVEAVYCLGNCALSPAAMVNGRLVGRADVARLDALVAGARA
jgi:formate dehydrogenase subunit gamma